MINIFLKENVEKLFSYDLSYFINATFVRTKDMN
jgi:hypothetical protein